MKRRLIAVMLLTSFMTSPAFAHELDQGVRQDMPELMALYRDLHEHPELSMQETRSAGLLAAWARRLGFEVPPGVGGTGRVAVRASGGCAVLRNGEDPVLLLRADMDALPVEEQTALAFASRARGTSVAGIES